MKSKTMKLKLGLRVWMITCVALALVSFGVTAHAEDMDRIQPYSKNGFYWQYKGQPVLLLGGSGQDNLFNNLTGLQPGDATLEEHLDLLVSVGGNYVRNTMHARNQGNVFPFKQLPNGKYDLAQWNEEYWRRFENFLKLTAERDIIVQIELWDQWDYCRGLWERDPWNPDLNINYTTDNTQLKGSGHYNDVTHRSVGKLDLFLTVPEVHNDSVVLAYQQKFVDKVLSHTFKYHHVLYTITNELFLQHPPEWSWYWARYIRQKAAKAGVKIEVTEMLQIEDVTHEQHKASLDHPEIFTFVDVSQNSGVGRQVNWEHFQYIKNYLKEHPRPINSVKMYGKASGSVPNFWRTLLGGGASARFHRDISGIGLNAAAQASIAAVRKVESMVPFWEVEPSQHLLSQRDDDEAYLAANPGRQYVLFFPNGGSVDVNLVADKGQFLLRWVNISTGAWGEEAQISEDKQVTVTAPSTGPWAAVIIRREM